MMPDPSSWSAIVKLVERALASPRQQASLVLGFIAAASVYWWVDRETPVYALVGVLAGGTLLSNLICGGIKHLYENSARNRFGRMAKPLKALFDEIGDYGPDWMVDGDTLLRVMRVSDQLSRLRIHATIIPRSNESRVSRLRDGSVVVHDIDAQLAEQTRIGQELVTLIRLADNKFIRKARKQYGLRPPSDEGQRNR